MRIFYVDRFIAYPTQMYNYLQELALQKGHEVYFVGPNEKNSHNISPKFNDYIFHIWSKNNFVRKILDRCKKLHPDLIHISFEFRTFGTLQSIIKFPFLLFLLSLNNSNIILSIHSILIYKEFNKWKFDQEIPISMPNLVIKLLAKLFFKSVCNKSKKIIVFSKVAKEGLVEYYSINQNKIKVMKLGIPDEPDYNNDEKLNFLKQFNEKKIILFFGLISPRKGHEIAIRAFNQIYKEIPNHILVITGQTNPEFSSYKENLKKLVNDLGIQDRVFFTGYISEIDVSILFDNSQVALYPYLSTSAGTASLLYAIKHNTPAILSNIGTFREILDDESAKFVEINDSNQLANAITEVCTDSNLRKRMCEKMELKKFAFKWKNIADEHLKFYEEIIS